MSWHTPGPGTSKTRVSGNHPVHSVTGAQSLREHKRIKREQAYARNIATPVERTRAYRLGRVSYNLPPELGINLTSKAA